MTRSLPGLSTSCVIFIHSQAKRFHRQVCTNEAVIQALVAIGFLSIEGGDCFLETDCRDKSRLKKYSNGIYPKTHCFNRNKLIFIRNYSVLSLRVVTDLFLLLLIQQLLLFCPAIEAPPILEPKSLLLLSICQPMVF